jgi:hypothetical protein
LELTTMIEALKQSTPPAFGFKVTGELTAADITTVAPLIAAAITANHAKPIGLLSDLTAMHGATWAARWDELHFLRDHSDSIARIAVVCDLDWQQVSEMALNTAAGMQAETRYFLSSELDHAWHWARMGPHDDAMPVRVLYPGVGLFGDYNPEYVGI